MNRLPTVSECSIPTLDVGYNNDLINVLIA